LLEGDAECAAQHICGFAGGELNRIDRPEGEVETVYEKGHSMFATQGSKRFP
jgi:hypothetical protein